MQSYLVDFNTAEQIKLSSGMDDQVTYKDIMMIEHTIPSKDVWKLTEPVVDKMTTEVAAKIKELNGDKSVSAAFIVGGGGKIHGYTEMLAKKLDLPAERVALRGEEVLQEVTFLQTEIQKDPLLVTPIGICLNYYDQRNSFIMVRFNGERIKLYDNNKLTIVDAALQAGFPNEELFPKRGKELNFTVNGTPRIVRGELGESAEIYMNDRLVNINTPLEPNSDIVIEASTQGEAAVCTLEQLDEYSSSEMKVIVNGRIVRCPKCLEVNGSLELPSYEIKEGDAVETRSFYTVEQLAAFMDVEVDMDHEILVNNRVATMESLVYENFSVDWVVLSFGAAAVDPAELPVAEQSVTAADGGTDQTADETLAETAEAEGAAESETQTGTEAEEAEHGMSQEPSSVTDATGAESAGEEPSEGEAQQASQKTDLGLVVFINQQPVRLTGKKSYIFVDIFDFYDFDLTASAGRAIITKLNGQQAQYSAVLSEGDQIELRWQEINR